jgi:hypothetical protein
VSDDPVADAVAELYGAPPETFTERRGELAAAARSAGDRAAAKAIGALRRPTRAAWLVNRLARTDPSAPVRLAELGGELRAAEQARQGARLRELSAARGALIDALTAQALAAADVPEPPAALRDEVTATLTAALADPEVAAAFAAGTLTRAAHWSGFGSGDFGSFGAGADAGESAGDSVTKRREPAGGGSPAGETGGRKLTLVPPRPGTAARDAAQAAARRAQLEQERQALAAAERRQKYAAAERVLAEAVTAAADAGAAEERLEAEVRELEDRLTRTRADLAAVRMNARHAEAAERRARVALDRLTRE